MRLVRIGERHGQRDELEKRWAIECPFCLCFLFFLFFFFNDTATTEIYTLSLHDALPDLGGLSDTVEIDARSEEIAQSNNYTIKEYWLWLNLFPANIACDIFLLKPKFLSPFPAIVIYMYIP